MLREMLPGPLPSKEADSLALDMLEAMARQIGMEAFHAMILKAIETCERRPTIATLRRIAGLNDRLDGQQTALAEAWSLVTTIVTRHTGQDGEGNCILQSHHSRGADDKYYEEPVPNIPDGVRKAVAALGGWEALVESHPVWWGQKFSQFKEVYRGESPTASVKN